VIGTSSNTKTIGSQTSESAPKCRTHAAHSRPVTASTIGYRGEIGALHARHFPRSHSQPRTGTLSYGLIGVPHEGHAEGGCSRDS
jgi:hypothetical protein